MHRSFTVIVCNKKIFFSKRWKQVKQIVLPPENSLSNIKAILINFTLYHRLVRQDIQSTVEEHFLKAEACAIRQSLI